MKFTMKKKTACITAGFLLLVARTSFPLNGGATMGERLLSDTIFTSVFSCPSPHKIVLGEPHRVSEACAVLTISYGGNVFLGGNADTPTLEYRGATPYLFFFPRQAKGHGTGNGHGFAVLGWERGGDTESYRTFVSGINEKGLAFGASGLPPVPMNLHPERPYSASSETFEVQALRECSSVACVIEMAKEFNWGTTSILLNQYHFADSTGDAVVISAGKDGELAFTRIEKGKYLVSTNFNRANPENGKYPCWRYDTAVSMLQKSEQENSVDYVTSILDAIHVEGALSNTSFSYIFDLHACDIYMYYFHQFNEVTRIDLAEELADERFSGYDSLISHGEYLPRLFSLETRENAVSEFRRNCCVFFVAILSLFSAAGLSGFFLYRNHHRKSAKKL